VRVGQLGAAVIIVVAVAAAVALVAPSAGPERADVVDQAPIVAARAAPSVVPATASAPAPVATMLAAATYQYGAEARQLLDVYLPATAPAGTAPVLVYFHAGGWVAGARTDLPDIVTAQLARGWAVVSVDYALAPDHMFPQPVIDGDLAVQWVRANGAALGLDVETIVAVGASAGGHVAAWLAAIGTSVDAAVLLVSPVVMADLRLHDDTFAPAILAAYLGCAEGRAARCTDEQLAASDPTQHMGADPAPVYVLHGGLDGMFPAAVHGVAVADAWTRAGQTAVVEVAPFAGHNLDVSNVDVRAIEAFLDQAVATRNRTSS
jgi:acetyl esterase/lipase